MSRLRTLGPILVAILCIALPSMAHEKIKTVLGGGPNGIPGLAVNLPNIGQVAVDTEGNLYILSTDFSGSGVVYKWSHGILTQIAGDQTYFANSDSNPVDSFNGDSGTATRIQLSGLNAIAVDSSVPANVYISDSEYCVVLKIDQSTGLASEVAGSLGTASYDSGPSCGYYPLAVAVNPTNGDLYVAQNYGGVQIVPGPGSTSGLGVPNSYEDCSAYPSYNVPGVCQISLALDTSVTPANVYIAVNCRIDEVVGATGKIYTVAGSTIACGFADKVIATQGMFNQIQQISVTGNGTTATVRVADGFNSDIREFTVTSVGGVPHPGLLTTVAGEMGAYNCNPASKVALGACFSPGGVAFDSRGNTYLTDNDYGDVDEFTPAGTYSLVVGWEPYLSVFSSNPQVLVNSRAQPQLWSPSAVFADPASTHVFVGASGNNSVLLWNSATSRTSNFAGNGLAGFAGDGKSAIAPGTKLNSPSGMAKDDSGNIYIADAGNCRIRVVNAITGVISTFAGESPCGYSGDGGSALHAQFDGLNSLAFDAHGDLFVADTNNCAIRRIDAHTRIITTIAGGLPAAQCANGAFAGDGGPAGEASLWKPLAVSFDGAGNLYIADSGNAAIREIIASTGIIETVAGIGGNPGFDGDPGLNGNGLATQAQLNTPSWVKSDVNGNLFISDTGNNVLRWVTPSGQIITFAGTSPPLVDDTFLHRGFEGDGGLAINASLYTPGGLDQDSAGNFYFADEVNNRIRQVSAFPGYGMSASSLTFASQPVGAASASQTVRISSIGPTKISLLTVSDGFKETDNCAYTELAAGQACEVQISFDPKTAGSFSGTLRVYSNAFLMADGYGVYNGNPDTVSLTGMAYK